jgi:hypothetical protein
MRLTQCQAIVRVGGVGQGGHIRKAAPTLDERRTRR